MRQCEYEEVYDPKMGRHVERHIFSGGGVITDTLKAVGKKLFGKTSKEIAKKAATTAATKAAEKTGEYAGKKAGDKIVELLSKKRKTSTPIPIPKPRQKEPEPEMTQQEAFMRVNRILEGGRLRRRR